MNPHLCPNCSRGLDNANRCQPCIDCHRLARDNQSIPAVKPDPMPGPSSEVILQRHKDGKLSIQTAPEIFLCSRHSIQDLVDQHNAFLFERDEAQHQLATARDDHQQETETLRDERDGNRAVYEGFKELIRHALDQAGAPTHHPDIGAPARKPMMPQERIAALAQPSTSTSRIAAELRRQASQENHDGEPYDTMVKAATMIDQQHAEITRLEAELATTSRHQQTVTIARLGLTLKDATIDRLERQLAEARDQVHNADLRADRAKRERDAFGHDLDAARTLAGGIIAAIRINTLRGTFTTATPEQIDEWLQPFIQRLNAQETAPKEPEATSTTETAPRCIECKRPMQIDLFNSKRGFLRWTCACGQTATRHKEPGEA